MVAGVVNKIARGLLAYDRAASVATIELDQVRKKLGMLLHMEDESRRLTFGYLGHEWLSPETEQGLGAFAYVAVGKNERDVLFQAAPAGLLNLFVSTASADFRQNRLTPDIFLATVEDELD